jgi:hypothetical protein
VIGGIAKRRTQALDGSVQAVLEIDEGPLWPQSLPKLVPRHHFARVLEHQTENFKRLLLQSHAAYAITQLPRTAIELERRESKYFAVHRSGL